MLIAFILLIVVISAYFHYKNKQSHEVSRALNTPTKIQQQKLQSMIDSKKYWGFTIDFVNEHHCCDAAKLAAKKPFPINSVPALPLDNCTKTICRCRYAGLLQTRQPLHQRRETKDRRGSIRFEEVTDRRSHRDRRSDNWILQNTLI